MHRLDNPATGHDNLSRFVLLGLVERLRDGDCLVIAEGYLWEFERRCFVKHFANIPEVVLEHPEVVRNMHEEFARAGSDVIEAYTVIV